MIDKNVNLAKLKQWGKFSIIFSSIICIILASIILHLLSVSISIIFPSYNDLNLLWLCLPLLIMGICYIQRQISNMDKMPPPKKIFRFSFCNYKRKYKKYNKTGKICPIKIEATNTIILRPELPDLIKKSLHLKKNLNAYFKFIAHHVDKIIALMSYHKATYSIQCRDNILSHIEQNAHLPHNAIIICPSRGFTPYYFIYGPDILVDYFLTLQIPYKVYIPSNVDEFNEIIRNENAAVLWLFGHGSIGSFTITRDISINYIDYIQSSWRNYRKIAIHQLHCNNKNRESPHSLSKILVDGWDFHEKGINTLWTIRAYVEYALSHRDKFPGIWEMKD